MTTNDDYDLQICLLNHERTVARVHNDSVVLTERNKGKNSIFDLLLMYIQYEQCEEYVTKFGGGTRLEGRLYSNSDGLFISIYLEDIEKTREEIIRGLRKLCTLKNYYEQILSIEKLAKYLLGVNYKIETVEEEKCNLILECCELNFINVKNQNVIYMVNCFNSYLEGYVKRIIGKSDIGVLLTTFDENYFKTNNYFNLECNLNQRKDEQEGLSFSNDERNLNISYESNMAVEISRNISCPSRTLDPSMMNEICQLGCETDSYQQTFIDFGVNSGTGSIICDSPAGTGKTLCAVVTGLMRLKKGMTTIIVSPTDSGCLSVIKELNKIGSKMLEDEKYRGSILNVTSYTYDISDDNIFDDSYSIESYVNNGYIQKLWENLNLKPEQKNSICEAIKEIKLIKLFLKKDIRNPTADDVNRVSNLTKYKNILRNIMLEESKPKIIITNLETLFRDKKAFKKIADNSLFIVNEVELIECWRIVLLNICFQKSSYMFVGDSAYINGRNRFIMNDTLYHMYFNKNIFNKEKKLSLQTAYRYKTKVFELVSHKLYKNNNMTSFYETKYCGSTEKCFLLVHNKKHQFIEESNGIRNNFEAEQVIFFISFMEKNKIAREDIAILCFYRSQKKLLRSMLLHPYTILTIEESQGLEFPYTIICTSTSKNDDIISDNYRFRVALTRAQLGMHIIIHENVMDDFKKSILEDHTVKC